MRDAEAQTDPRPHRVVLKTRCSCLVGSKTCVVEVLVRNHAHSEPISQVERIGPMTHSACTDQLEQILGMTPKPVYAYCTEEY